MQLQQAHIYNNLPILQKDWRKHENDVCPVCGSSRFEETSEFKNQLHPREFFFYFPLSDTITERLKDERYAAARASKEARDPANADIWGGLLPPWMVRHGAEHLLEETRDHADGKVRRPGGLYELGYDDARPFKNDKAQHSSGFVFGRCADLPPSERSKKHNVFLWCLFPGPRQKRISVDLMFAPLVEELERLGTSGLPVFDAYLGEEVTHFPYLGPVSVDTKAREVLLRTVAVGSKRPDYRTRYKAADWDNVNRHAYCTGYATPVDQVVPAEVVAGEERRLEVCSVFADDPRLRLSHADMYAMSSYVHDAPNKTEQGARARKAGRHGHSPLSRLKYFNYQWHTPPPMYHGVFYGMVKHFWRMLLGKHKSIKEKDKYAMPNTALKMWRERGMLIHSPQDEARAYTDIVDGQGNWTMEDWRNWTFLYSDAVVGASLHHEFPQFAEAWSHLREALMYYFMPGVIVEQDVPLAERSAHRDTARHHLRQFAVIMEEHGPPQMLSLSTRMVVVHSYDQEEWTGSLYHTNEMWVEQGVHHMKMYMGAYTGSPEARMGKGYLMERHYARRSEEGSTSPPNAMRSDVMDVEPVGPVFLHAPLKRTESRRRRPDTTGDVRHVVYDDRLSNASMTADERRLVQAHITEAWGGQNVPDGGVGEGFEASVLRYTHAELGNGEVVTSQDNKRTRSRRSWAVTVFKAEKKFFGVIKAMWKVTAPNGDVKRIAIFQARAGAQRDEVARRDLDGLRSLIPLSEDEETWVGDLSSISMKVILVTVERADHGGRDRYAIPMLRQRHGPGDGPHRTRYSSQLALLSTHKTSWVVLLNCFFNLMPGVTDV